MLEQDRIYLSKYAIDPDLENDSEIYDLPEIEFETDEDSELDYNDIDRLDEDFWGE